MNPGDKVQIYRPNRFFHGFTGTVVGYSGRLVLVELDKGRGKEYFQPEDVQPAEEPE